MHTNLSIRSFYFSKNSHLQWFRFLRGEKRLKSRHKKDHKRLHFENFDIGRCTNRHRYETLLFLLGVHIFSGTDFRMRYNKKLMMNQQTYFNEQKNKQTNKQTYEQTNVRTNNQTNKQNRPIRIFDPLANIMIFYIKKSVLCQQSPQHSQALTLNGNCSRRDFIFTFITFELYTDYSTIRKSNEYPFWNLRIFSFHLRPYNFNSLCTIRRQNKTKTNLQLQPFGL